MKDARSTYSRGAMKGKGMGKLNKDEGCRPEPGFTMSEKIKEWPARTGYASESRTGASKHGTKIKLP